MYNQTVFAPSTYNFYEHISLYGFICLALVGVIIASLSKLISVPYQIPSIIIGIGLGGLAYLTNTNFEQLEFKSNFMLSIYLPIVVVKITYKIESYLLVKSLPQIALISTVGYAIYIITLFLLIGILQTTITTNLKIVILAVIMTPLECPDMLDFDGIRNLETIMRGEAIFGISLCRILYLICVGIEAGFVVKWYQMIAVFIRYVAIALPIGYISGAIGAMIFRYTYNDSRNATCMLIAVAFFAYSICEHICFCSGPLASFIALYNVTKQRSRLVTKVDSDVIQCINVVYYFFHILLIIIYSMFITNTWMEMFEPSDLVESTAAYIVANVVRLVVFLVLSPLLSRIGYGFDFTSLVTIFWAVEKGPIQLIQVVTFMENVYTGRSSVNIEIMVYTLVFVFFTYVINTTTLKIFLTRFGLLQLSARRKNNINIAINAMDETRTRVLTMLKMNRFYSDANWAIIYDHTKLATLLGNLQEDHSKWQKDSVICKTCNAVVPLETNPDQYNDQFKDLTLRVLKAQRISFVKQHETGYLSKVDVRILLQAIEVAMDNGDLSIKLNQLFICIDNGFRKAKTMHMLTKIAKIFLLSIKMRIPKLKSLKRLYFMLNSKWFDLINVIVIIKSLTIIALLLSKSIPQYHNLWHILDSLCNAFFLFEISMKLAINWDTDIKDMIKAYFKNFWNKIDVFCFIIYIVDIAFAIGHHLGMPGFYYIRWIRMLSLVKLLKILCGLCPLIVTYIERNNDLQLMTAFVIATAIVISCEEVIEILPTFTENTSMQEIVKVSLLKTRSVFTQRLGLVEKERPALTTTVKTIQALRAILKYIRKDMTELQASSLIDRFEFNKLSAVVNMKQKYLDNLKLMEVIQPKSIFDEIPWLCASEDLLNFIYHNVKTRIFTAGDVLCKQGDIPDGVYIIVAGYFKVTYYPSDDQIHNLVANGELPIKEFLEYMRFGEIQEDYLTCGNRMGELAVLTNRPYSCSIVAEAPSQAFIIPRDILQRGMHISPDPVLGLSAKIWKSILIGLGKRILLATPAYQSVSGDQVDTAMNRAIVPDLSYYNVVVFSQVVEDVLLLEGVAIDYNTREVFTAPCAIPRHVTKLLIPRSSLVALRNISTKLMIIPPSHVDEYEMMQTIEHNSELLPDHNYVMLSSDTDRRTRKKHRSNNIFSLQKLVSSGYVTHKVLSGKASSIQSEEKHLNINT